MHVDPQFLSLALKRRGLCFLAHTVQMVPQLCQRVLHVLALWPLPLKCVIVCGLKQDQCFVALADLAQHTESAVGVAHDSNNNNAIESA